MNPPKRTDEFLLFRPEHAHKVPALPKLYLDDIKWKFSEDSHARETCAACNDPIPEDEVPLMLFRKGGKEIIALHWSCAESRFILE